MSKEQFKIVQKAMHDSAITNGISNGCQSPITVPGHAVGAKWPEAEKMVADLTRFEGISNTTSVKEQVAHETEAFYYSKTQKVNPILTRRAVRTN